MHNSIDVSATFDPIDWLLNQMQRSDCRLNGPTAGHVFDFENNRKTILSVTDIWNFEPNRNAIHVKQQVNKHAQVERSLASIVQLLN